jgi:hypothetical protein
MRYLTGTPLFIEATVDENGLHTTPFGAPDKQKRRMAVVAVSGEKVLTKRYKVGDVAIKRVTENLELLWHVEPVLGTEEVEVSFVKRELTAELFNLLEKHHIHLLQVMLSREKADQERSLAAALKETESLTAIRQVKGRLNLLCDTAYFHLRLPVLGFFLLLLLGNFFVNDAFVKEYNEQQRAWNVGQRKSREIAEKQTKYGKIEAEYARIPRVSFARLSDRIASYVPTGMLFDELSIFPPTGSGSIVSRKQEVQLRYGTIRVKGETEVPGCVTLFTHYLERDPLFKKVEVVSLDRPKNSSSYHFEIHLSL